MRLGIEDHAMTALNEVDQFIQATLSQFYWLAMADFAGERGVIEVQRDFRWPAVTFLLQRYRVFILLEALTNGGFNLDLTLTRTSPPTPGDDATLSTLLAAYPDIAKGRTRLPVETEQEMRASLVVIDELLRRITPVFRGEEPARKEFETRLGLRRSR